MPPGTGIGAPQASVGQLVERSDLTRLTEAIWMVSIGIVSTDSSTST
jgi:hypothetical protein